MTTTPIRTTTTAKATGQGPLTAGVLRGVLADTVLIPDNARITAKWADDQRDGAFWSVEATWTTGGAR